MTAAIAASGMTRAARERRRVLDAIAFGVVVVGGVVSRRSVRPLRDEERRPLPGDALLPHAKDRWTHAVTIQAPSSVIWPWLVQMGCRRGGWYSYDGLDNGSRPSADRIHPALQEISVGDLIAWTPQAVEGFFVAEIEPERALVLRGDAGGLYRVTWAFVLEPIDAQATRLLARASGDYERRSVGLMLQVIWRPIHFAMERKQLLTLRKRIEAMSRPSGAGVGMAGGKARLPPRWFVVAFWHGHRWIVQASGGRKGLWLPRPGKWGALRLTTRGRRSGEPRSVIVGYYEDGSKLISMAMNGWGAAEPAWWLNLRAHPEAVVELAGGIKLEVLGRAAVGGERERLWQRWRELDQNLDGYAARRPQETAVVVLEPRVEVE